MPYYYRRNYYPKWRRWRSRRNRFRRHFRRRTYRRRWVSNPFNKITLKQWQPPYKKTCYIKGQTCLIYYNNDRLGFNSVMYEKSIVPFHWPGGGSFCVSKFTLDGLFDMHKECRNWWTGSNLDLPLCKYKGCTLTFYQAQNTDFIFKVTNEQPAVSNKLTYPSTHPQIMLMSNQHHILSSTQNRKKRKPYTRIHIPPPEMFENKWYFTQDLFKLPLLQIFATAANMPNPYLKPNRKSNNTVFYGINTESIQNREMSVETNQSWPFKKLGTQNYYFYYYTLENPPSDSGEILVKNLIAVADIKNNKPGQSFSEQQTTNRKTWQEYFNSYSQFWGNPFNHQLNEHPEYFYYSFISPEQLATTAKSKSETMKWSELTSTNANYALTKFDQPIFIPYQYNPEKDTGEDTQCYFLSNREGHGWDPPGIPEITLEGFPMWLILWGFADFQKNLKKIINIDTTYILTIKSKFTQRPRTYPIVPINESFMQGNSPYENTCLPEDITKWYPMYQYQTQEQNKILQTGPFAPYIQNLISDNLCMYYKFKFQWGGSPPKTVNVENPSHQNIFPIPRNEHETTSLQSPGTAPESILYSFDFRHGDYTTKALTRITKDWPIKETVSKITEPESGQLLQQMFQFLQTSEETQEKKEKEMQQYIQLLRQQQQQYRERIASILNNQQL
nr:MAG: ORF1 [TTV-like mini virus]